MSDGIMGAGGGARDGRVDDEAYWRAFRRRVLDAAGPELSRRREAARVPGILEVLFAWRRQLAPAALAVAVTALASLWLVADAADSPAAVQVPPEVGLEEILIVAPEEREVDLRLRAQDEMHVDEVFAAVEGTP